MYIIVSLLYVFMYDNERIVAAQYFSPYVEYTI